MAKNLIPEICKMLGVELGEEFKIKGHEELTYRFASDGLKLTYDNNIELSDIAAKVAFVALLNGKDEIVKLQWKPKKCECVIFKKHCCPRCEKELRIFDANDDCALLERTMQPKYCPYCGQKLWWKR